MTHRLHSIALLLLAGCTADPEAGIDRTFIRGTVLLPPGELAEADAGKDGNNAAEFAEDLGFIASRYTIVSGSASDFNQLNGEASGDLDFYTFSPLKSGSMSLSLVYESTTDTESSDSVYYQVVVLGPDGKPVVSTTTQDYYGSFSVDLTVESGATYTVMLGGMVNREGTDGSYQLILSGFDPNGVIAGTGEALEAGWSVQDGEIYSTAPTDFLVGVYTSADPSARGLPVGGTDVPEFTLDEETYTWSGDYEVTYVYSATLPEVADTGEFASPEIDVSLSEVYVFAGTFPSLNAGLTAGTLYSSTPLTINLGSATAEEYEAGALGVSSTNEVIVAEDLSCDLVQPKQYGWTEADTEKNNFADAGDGYTIADPSGAQALPVATGAGYIDTVTGTLDFLTDDPGWEGETDAFILTVPETLDAYISVSWPDPSYNIDVNFYDSTGAIIGAGWSVADVNPEAFSISGDVGIYLEPGETYYLGLFGWSGAAGGADYTIEIEWLAP